MKRLREWMIQWLGIDRIRKEHKAQAMAIEAFRELTLERLQALHDELLDEITQEIHKEFPLLPTRQKDYKAEGAIIEDAISSIRSSPAIGRQEIMAKAGALSKLTVERDKLNNEESGSH